MLVESACARCIILGMGGSTLIQYTWSGPRTCPIPIGHVTTLNHELGQYTMYAGTHIAQAVASDLAPALVSAQLKEVLSSLQASKDMFEHAKASCLI